MATLTRKPPWTLDHWHAFAARCRSLRDRISALIRTFPETPGLTPGHINGLIRTHTRLVYAMMRAESVLADQHGEAPSGVGVITFIHGEKGTATWGSCRGRVRRDAKVLPRERWAELGREVKAIRAALRALLIEFQGTAGATKPYVNRFIKAERALDSAKCKLDSLVCRQHPDWADFGKVFYGPTDPAL